MRWSRVLGAVLILAAIGGSVAAITAAGDLRDAVDERSSSLDQALVAGGEALRTADDTVAIVVSIVDQLAGSLAAVEDAALDSISTLDDAENGLNKLAEISGEDLPRIIDSLKEAMPALIQVADVIDGTLGALSFVGVPYDPDVPFDESLSGIADSIDDLPEQVRHQADLIEEVAEGLGGIADQAGQLIIEMGVARLQLLDGIELLNQYRATTATAIESVETERDLLAERPNSERSAIWWLAAAVVMAQLGLFTAGTWLLFRKSAAPPGDA
jgi:methyl-accepting chemotaxis protein